MPRPKSQTTAEAIAEIFDRPAIGLGTTAALMDSSPATISRLIAADEFPTPVVRLGSRMLVVSQPLIELLHLRPPEATEPAA